MFISTERNKLVVVVGGGGVDSGWCWQGRDRLVFKCMVCSGRGKIRLAGGRELLGERWYEADEAGRER